MTRRPSTWSLAILLGIFVVALALAILMGQASGHDPYTGLQNPVTGVDCCHGQDCKPVEASEIGEDGASYTYQGALFPKSQTQQSPDHRYHVCAGIEWFHSGTSRPMIRCLLRPTPGS